MELQSLYKAFIVVIYNSKNVTQVQEGLSFFLYKEIHPCLFLCHKNWWLLKKPLTHLCIVWNKAVLWQIYETMNHYGYSFSWKTYVFPLTVNKLHTDCDQIIDWQWDCSGSLLRFNVSGQAFCNLAKAHCLTWPLIFNDEVQNPAVSCSKKNLLTEIRQGHTTRHRSLFYQYLQKVS